MENKYYSLEVNKGNRLTRAFQLIFGIVCALLAVTWIILNPDSFKWNTTLLPVLFLSSFSWYMINSGLGKGEKYIEIGRDSITVKRNSLFPARTFNAPEIERIDVFPLSMVIHLREGSRFLLRFGTTFTEIIDPVKRGIEELCSMNNIPAEFMNEEI